MEKDFIEKSLEANKEKVEGLGMADLSDPNSTVNKAPEVEKVAKKPLPTKPKVDESGFPELETLKTYHDNVADAVRSNSLSMLKVAVKQQSAKQYTPDEEFKKASNTHLWLQIGASLLFVSGIITVAFAWFSKQIPIPTTPNEVRSIIFTEDSASINIFQNSPREIRQKIQEELAISEKEKVKKINLVEISSGETRKLSIEEIIYAIGATPPSNFVRSLSENSMIGLFQNSEKAEPFIIFISSSESAFPGMFEWERTMGHDLESIMGSEGTDRTMSFKDKIILNRDSRVLGKDGTEAFFYSIIDSRIVIIAKSEDTFEKILDRIRENKLR